MRSRIPTRVIQSAMVLVIAGSLLMVGRLTVDSGRERAEAHKPGHSDGHYAEHFTGHQDGGVQGR